MKLRPSACRPGPPSRFRLPAVLAVGAAIALLPQAASAGFFPYEVHRRTLDNGLDVLVIPTPEFKNVLSYNTMVLAGARNEVEPGKSGLAHLFEHILFRHRFGGEEGGYEKAIGDIGAFNNAWTWFDVTYYHPLTFTSNFTTLAELESSRFKGLDISERIFQTEAGAVLGEYRRIATDPGLRMEETMARLMYGSYGYGHTAIGFLEDVEDMPNKYDAALRFYDDYYAPNNVVVVIAGDVDVDEAFSLAKRNYADWKRRDIPRLEPPAPVDGPKREDIEWSVDVPPRVQVGYRIPPFKTGSVATAVGEILPELLTSETARLYQTLRYDKQTASALFTDKSQYESFGPGPLVLTAILYKEKYAEKGQELVREVEADIEAALGELARFADRPDAVQTLESLKSKYAYDLLANLDSPASTALTFVHYYKFERDLDVFDALVASVKALTPEDIEDFARATFTPANRVTVTLTHGSEAGAR